MPNIGSSFFLQNVVNGIIVPENKLNTTNTIDIKMTNQIYSIPTYNFCKCNKSIFNVNCNVNFNKEFYNFPLIDTPLFSV
jgi:hypothetical protein